MSSGYQFNGTDLYNYYQQPFSGSTNTSVTDYTVNGTALSLVSLSSTPTTAVANSGFTSNALGGGDLSTYVAGLVGEHLYTTAGASFTFTVPAGVTSICILCIGGSAGTNASGVNNRSGNTNSSWFGGSSTTPIVSGTSTIVFAGGGSGSGQGGGTGNEWYPTGAAGPTVTTPATGTVYYTGGAGSAAGSNAGGGAAGYAGNGGAAGTTGVAGTGGAGGGGSTNKGGGGVGVYGQGANGAAGGGGGSGGTNGAVSTVQAGGLYGGGCAGGSGGGGGGALAYLNNYTVTPGATYNVTVGVGGKISAGNGGPGGSGAVRILWGKGRSFPSTNVGTAFNQALN